LKFYVDDVEDPWIEKDHFDFIFARDLTPWIKDPGFVLESAFEALKPGGYIEFQNIILPLGRDGHTVRKTAFKEWLGLIGEGGKSLSLKWHTTPEWKTKMEQVGFVDIQVKEYSWPIGTWPIGKESKRFGAWVYENLVAQKGIDAISAKVLTEGIGMNIDAVVDLIERVTWELKYNIVRAILPA
jgi:SAM-dependent methyltransferase